MRSVSEHLMEFGADFTHGVSLTSAHCGVRVSPSPTDSSLRIEAASNDDSFSEDLALTMEQLARRLDEKA